MNITFENLTVDQANELINLAKKWEMTNQVDIRPEIKPFRSVFEPCFICHQYHGNMACPKTVVTSDQF